jgi:leucyl/phenylalanyl-tRNA--protein transferase
MLPPPLILRAYRAGLFPMAMEGGEIGWFSPDPRGVIPLDGFHVPTRLRRLVRQGRFHIETDRAFEEVMRACATRPGEGTWISPEIAESYLELHRLGRAHSVEAWQDHALVGGLYGVHLGAAFFGESMFHRVTDASKVVLVALVDRLKQQGFELLDVQWLTPHLATFGGVEIPRPLYLQKLTQALGRNVMF